MKPGRNSDEGHEKYKHRSIAPRFRDAFLGICGAYREEPNLRFHVFAAACAVVAGVAVRPAPWEVGYLSLTVLAVLLAEMVNTAVERAVDFAAAGRRHPLAGQAKEVAAGAVLLSAIHAVFAAGYVFLYSHAFSETAAALWTLVRERPWWAVLPLAAAVLGVTGGNRATR